MAVGARTRGHLGDDRLVRELSALDFVLRSGLAAFRVEGPNEEWRISEWGTPGFVVTHGEGDRRVDVGVLRKEAPADRDRPSGSVDVYETLATRLIHERHQAVPAGVTPAHWFAGLESRLPSREAWHPEAIAVDGAETPFLRLAEEGHWIAFTDTADTWLYVHSAGRDPGEIRLVRIQDPARDLG